MPDTGTLYTVSRNLERQEARTRAAAAAAKQHPTTTLIPASSPAPAAASSAPTARVVAPYNSPFREITKGVIATSIVLGIDYSTTSMPYGMALKAEALVKSPQWGHLLQRSEWKEAYTRSWSVLKYGFYPTFLLEKAATETTKHFGTSTIADYSDLVMPGLVGMGTAPAVSFAGINARYGTQLDVLQVLRTQGIRGVTRLTGGAGTIGVRELTCYQVFHHDTSEQAKYIANAGGSRLFKRQDGTPTIVSTAIADIPDGLALLATQPLTMFAVNAAKHKYAALLQPNATQKPSITAPVALLKYQLEFLQQICSEIMKEGKTHGLNRFLSFSPGIVARTVSLFGTLSVFKYCLGPAEKVVADNVTHRKLGTT